MKSRQILDSHFQLRDYSCFQMAPELALKLAGLLDPTEYPFQNQANLDRTGYEFYRQPRNIGTLQLQFSATRYIYPYQGMIQKLKEEILQGNFPILSLRSAPNQPWHGYVAYEPIGDNDFLVLTKIGRFNPGIAYLRLIH